ncbi:hypothetical protein CWR48_05990 [Oceanobacillus arenosus]|uniref:Uncharacterized protein n=1 Tax=Oceanobacillus arenosus TaxID=1229153 RepID=A0A3D8PY53_9BACI|nr:hypothetical protein [Oceanobacillus arenosus]RDW20251.1 hypothetical protein CWR48_05990 [Oceanobacillus arenosus]
MNNQGQEKFLNFILERVKEDKKDEAREILTANFRKQVGGTFTQNDIQQFLPKMNSLLKPEKIEEVKEIVKQFAGNHGTN